MKYLIYNTNTERYCKSNTLPDDTSSLDVIDLESSKVIPADTTIGPYGLETYTESDIECEESEDAPEAEPISDSE